MPIDKEKVLNNAIIMVRSKGKVNVAGYKGMEKDLKKPNIKVTPKKGFFELKLM